MWAAGIAAGSALVARWRIVGPGFSWLTAGVAGLIGLGAAAAGGGPLAWAGVALAAAGAATARRPAGVGWLMAAAAVSFLLAGVQGSDPLLAATGALALGGVTNEMLLGHWYLVDPRLPRSALQRLDLIGIVGLALDAGYLAVRGALTWSAGQQVFGWVFVAMALTSILLMVGVWGALRQPSYTGVMAATGLSYLAVLTTIAAVIVGRSLLSGEGGILLLGTLRAP